MLCYLNASSVAFVEVWGNCVRLRNALYVLLVSRWTRNTHTFAICSIDRKLEHSTQLMTMTYGPKKYNPSSCVAPWQKLTMACDWITNFPSCVARRLLFHLILNCDHNTTWSSFEAHICVEHLHQIRRDEAIKYNWTLLSQVNRGAEAFFCITKANHVVHRVLFRFRSMIAADIIMLVRVMKGISVV